MTPETKKLLLSAWRENRLAGLHIDLQSGFDVGALTDLCSAVRNVADSLRKANIPNIWSMAKDFRWKDRITTVGAFDRDIYSIHGLLVPGIGARGDEIAVAKTEDSAFDNPAAPLHSYLKEQKKDTLLIGGVNARVCVSETVRDAVLSDLYNVIVLPDCINVPKSMYTEDYIEFLREECGNDILFSKHFYSATSAEVIETLSAAGPS